MGTVNVERRHTAPFPRCRLALRLVGTTHPPFRERLQSGLPWQFVHVRVLRSDASTDGETTEPSTGVTWKLLAKGLGQSIHVRNRGSDAEAWGGLVGLTWMVGY